MTSQERPVQGLPADVLHSTPKDAVTPFVPYIEKLLALQRSSQREFCIPVTPSPDHPLGYSQAVVLLRPTRNVSRAASQTLPVAEGTYIAVTPDGVYSLNSTTSTLTPADLIRRVAEGQGSFTGVKKQELSRGGEKWQGQWLVYEPNESGNSHNLILHEIEPGSRREVLADALEQSMIDVQEINPALPIEDNLELPLLLGDINDIAIRTGLIPAMTDLYK